MSNYTVRTPRAPQDNRRPTPPPKRPKQRKAAPRPRQAAPMRRRRPVNWFTVGMIAAPLFLIGTLGMIALMGVLFMSDGSPLALLPTPTPTPLPRWMPPYALSIRLYDPVRDESLTWDAPPDVWSNWIAAELTEAPNFPVPLDSTAVSAYLSERAAELGSDRRIDIDEAIAAVVNAAAGGTASIRVYHNDVRHIVQPGETIISLAWDYGIPYPYVQAANPGVDTLSVGQAVTIPSLDALLPLPIVPNKRVVVSIPEQRVRVYENGALKWDWSASTGIASSPTWTGVYQILSHEPNAYASNWDLWMPNFLGVYYPIPNADFVNGFHGFPTRGGSQLLWTNSLGTRVTYGCILLSNDNVTQLYQWAEDGVVVQIVG